MAPNRPCIYAVWCDVALIICSVVMIISIFVLEIPTKNKRQFIKTLLWKLCLIQVSFGAIFMQGQIDIHQQHTLSSELKEVNKSY